MRTAILLFPLLFSFGCAAQPLGPTVAVMPTAGKDFALFQS